MALRRRRLGLCFEALHRALGFEGGRGEEDKSGRSAAWTDGGEEDKSGREIF